ncbi:MAG: NAD-dependent epimerase/dehydratase family protein, partial [Gammaproteobacteria bacterium]|nr:NAD-dependent epimerase/dehydratase family protein [Gammaproteobacteria bacterium]
LDNLSRPGVEANLRWLEARHGERLRHVAGDVRDAKVVRDAVDGSDFVYHLAAQVAVTTSLGDPLEDHAINVAGTLNVLEAVRRSRARPGLLFASTNKVYGALDDVAMRAEAKRYQPEDERIRAHGIGEDRPLDFISPYGCSKGAADQYVLDYCHSFGIDAVVFRMSCIYGPRQRANSDQGWVTHFLRSALDGAPLTIFGDGRQVRDLLFIEDFVAALAAARRQIESLSGRAFNIGGGPANSMSLLELIEAAESLSRRPLELAFDEPRPGDQLYFAADCRRFTAETGWAPTTSPDAGIERLWTWLTQEAAEPAAPELKRGASWA